MKRLLTLLLTLSLAASLAAPAMARETHFFSAFPEEVPQQGRTWDNAAAQAADDALTALESALAAGADDDTLISLWQTAAGALTTLGTTYSFLTVDYARDPAAWGETYTAGTTLYTQLSNRYLAATKQLLSSACAPRLEAELGETADSYRQASTNTPEQLAMLEDETALVNDYWQIMSRSYAADAAGQTWTWDEAGAAYAAGTLSMEDYLAVQQTIAKAQNAGAAPILVQLVTLRNRYAASLGYDSYADYVYREVYGRDYTPREVQALQEAVKDYIVPLYQALDSVRAFRPELNLRQLTDLSGLDQETLLDLAEPVIKEVSDEYAELYDYMRAQDLCDIRALDTKAAKGFTTPLSEYGSAYLFNAPDGTYYDLDALTHEFGHFADFCLGPDQILCYDTAEICSQGLEVLSLHDAAALAGADGTAAYREAVVTQMLYSVISGCLEDEFQQQIYAAGDMTVQEMNRLYRDLLAEYGFNTLSDESYSWVQTSHTFETPFYYISYATSALSSLEILTRSMEDFGTAADTYLSVVALTDSTGYLDALARTGLSDVFQAGTVKTLAGGILGYTKSQILDLPDVTDVGGCWAEDAIDTCLFLGLFPVSGDQFQPQAALTGAEAADVLRRTAGAGDSSNDWAADAGLSDLAAAGTVTRQTLVSALYRLLGTEADTAVLRSFPDAAQVSPEAAEAMAWAVETGLIRGTSQGLLAPDRTITRAEAAALISRLFL